MDIFFATKKARKSSCGHTYCQLFVTDKGYVNMVPKKKGKEVILVVKQFAKEIGTPDAIICAHSQAQTSQENYEFCREICTMLCMMEEGAPWANKA
eukprot:1028190-Ditylum_brightwellii.AAC.1